MKTFLLSANLNWIWSFYEVLGERVSFPYLADVIDTHACECEMKCMPMVMYGSLCSGDLVIRFDFCWSFEVRLSPVSNATNFCVGASENAVRVMLVQTTI